jgi:hypothetical protein
MLDCPRCQRIVDGLFCRYCEDGRPPRTPPPMGFDGLRAAIKQRQPPDLEAAIERAAIEGGEW